MNKRKAVILVTGLLLLAACILGSVLQTAAFTVTVQPFSYITPAGYTLRGTMYRPNSATKDAQVPTVITCAGGSDEHSQQASVNIELARRGYAVFSFDAFNHGRSDFYITDTQGGLDMIHYALSFDWVDSTRLAVEGHSNGGLFLSQAALESKLVSTIIYCNVVPYDAELPFLAADTKVNAAFILCRYDEYAGPDNWGVPTALDAVSIPRLMNAFGTQKEITPEKHYGNLQQDTLRVLYTPASTHSFAMFSPQVVGNIIDFLDVSLSHQSTIPSHQQVAPLFILASCVSFICMLLLAGLLVDYMLDNSAFLDLVQYDASPISHPSGKAVLALCVASSVAFFVPLYLLGKRVLQVNMLYPQAESNGVVLWTIASSGIYLGIHFLFSKRAKNDEPTYQGHLLQLQLLGKTFLLAALGFTVLYILTGCKFELTSSGLSFLWSSLIPLTKQKAIIYVCYFVTFLPFFFSLNLLITKNMNHKSCKKSLVYAMSAYTLGPLILLTISYVFLLLYHRAPIHSARFAISPILYMLPILPICGACCTWFYRRTGKLYLGSFLNCFIFTWLLIGRNSTFFF